MIVVLSDKYLRSPYRMAKLHTNYRRSNEQKEEFLRRIIPLLLGESANVKRLGQLLSTLFCQ